jgi:hypothetical protein
MKMTSTLHAIPHAFLRASRAKLAVPIDAKTSATLSFKEE